MLKQDQVNCSSNRYLTERSSLSKLVVKSDSLRQDTNLLQGHAVTLAFKVTTQMLHPTRCLNIVIIPVK